MEGIDNPKKGQMDKDWGNWIRRIKPGGGGTTEIKGLLRSLFRNLLKYAYMKAM